MPMRVNEVMADVVESVLRTSRKKLIFASVKANVLYSWATVTNKVETEPGGWQIHNPIVLGRNPNVGTYTYYDELPLAPTNEFSSVEYTWSRAFGNMIISNQQIDENRGPGMLFKLLEKKYEVLEMSIKEKFCEWLYGAGAGAEPFGLEALIPDDPTVGTLGGINRATESQWRTSSYDLAGGLNPSNISEAFSDVLLDLRVNKESPDIIICGHDIYRTYRAAVDDKAMLQITALKDGKRMADLGFSGYSHQGVPLVFDEDCPPNKAYFINSNYLKMHVLSGVNMRVQNLTAPWNIDAIGRRVVWQGNMCLWRAYRTHGVVIN